MNKLLRLNRQYYFGLLCTFSLLFAYLGNRFLFTDSLYYSTLNEQFTNEQIKMLLNLRNKWVGISYFLVPVFIVIRVFYTSFCLFLGDLFRETCWGYKHMFNIALKADAVFVLNTIVIFYYYLIFGDYKTTNDLSIHPFSLLAVTEQESMPDWLTFAYNSVNVFEILYILTLAFLIRSITKINYLKAFVFVCLTYGVGNYLYIAGITFVYLNFS